MFPIIPVDPRLALHIEPLGTKRKFWYRDGETRMLFKAEDRGTGEDWAEKIACELCRLIGLPHVQYELAVESNTGAPGVICQTCAPPPTTLHLGNQLLLAIDASYPALAERRYKVREHTVDAVVDALALLGPMPGSDHARMPPAVESALDVFTGYLMLAAWIANQDRHHENWGVLMDAGKLSLAPTFDHGASLARNLTDQERGERLTSRDSRRNVAAFARRARSAILSDSEAGQPMTTVDAWAAFAARAPNAAAAWRERLAGIEPATIQGLIEEVPPQRMSSITRDFTMALLDENRRRLLTSSEQ